MRTKYNIGDRVYFMKPSAEFDDQLIIQTIEIVKIEISFEGILYKDYKGNCYQEHQ